MPDHLFYKPRLCRLAASFVLALGLSACNTNSASNAHEPTEQAPRLVDRQATPETQALYRNLARVGQESVLFGHQDSLAYGVEWFAEPGRSDVHSVTGAYPAVYGWELGNLGLGDQQNLDGVNFQKMQGWIKEGFDRGGIITIGWHMTSPITGESSWEKQPTTEHIIPGGEHHSALITYMDKLADFLRTLTYTNERGEQRPIPILFRPWHEHNGDWFWWGKSNTAEDDYIALWRFTVEYLRDEKGLNNLIYVYSLDRSRIDLDHFERDYFYGYPGDDYVDILGIDNYHDMGGQASNPLPRAQQQVDLVRSLQYTVRAAQARNKLPALSEGGAENIRNERFWTDVLLAALQADQETRKIAYALVWRNANREKEQRDHFYAPYPGHPSAENFVEFYLDPLTVFEDTLPDMYR